MADGSVCKSCGALLPLPDLTGHATCLSCGRNHRVATPPPEPEAAGPTAGPGAPVVIDLSELVTPATKQAAKAAGKGVSLGCMVVVLLVAVGVIGGSVMLVRSVATDVSNSFDSAFDSALDVTTDSSFSLGGGTVVPIPPSDPGPGAGVEQVAAVVYDGGRNERMVARLKLGPPGESSDPVWSSAPFPADVYDAPMATVGDTLMVGVDDELWALSLDNGSTEWTATLPDKVKPGCEPCFESVGDTLVVTTADDQVLGYGPGSSEPRWSRRLAVASARAFVTPDAVVLVDDDPAQPINRAVTVLDPVSGATRSTVSPICPPTEGGFATTMNFSDAVVAVPGSTDLVATVSGSSPCLVRWDGSTGVLEWTRSRDQSMYLAADSALATASHLFFSTPEGAVVAVYLADGSIRTLAAPADTSATPALVSGDLLVADTVTTRGTPRGGLAAWNLTTASPAWQAAMPDKSKPFSDRQMATSESLFPGSPLSMVAGGAPMVLFTFSGDDYSASSRTVDPATGAFGEPAVQSVGDGPGTISLGVHHVGPEGLLVSADDRIWFLPTATDRAPTSLARLTAPGSAGTVSAHG